MSMFRVERLRSKAPLLAYAKTLSCPTRGKVRVVKSRSTHTPPRALSISNTSIPTSTPNPALNPPPTTRPPVLALPTESTEGASLKYYINVGKAYLTFYKTGLKGIYTNYKVATALPERTFHPLIASRGTFFAAALAKKLSRADLQLLLRLRADTQVLPLFALVFMCCGELTPFLVPFLTAIVPPSIHIPLQTKKLSDKAERRRQQVRAEDPPEWRSIHSIWGLKPPTLDDKLRLSISRRMAIELALYPSWLEKLPLHISLVKRRLNLRLKELQFDDLMIIRDGGVQEMMAEEVTMACERRGLALGGKGETELRKMLEQWLEESKSDSANELTNWLIGEQRN